MAAKLSPEPWALSPLIVIVGPTASGKSALALELAQKFNGEIIAADSRTVYKGMDIGTAKPTEEEQKLVPHHLLDLVNPDQPFNVVNFQGLALEKIKEIQGRGKLPIMVGGTGLYVDSVIFNYQFEGKNAEKSSVNPRHLAKPSDARGPIRGNTLVLGMDVDKNLLEDRITIRVKQMVKGGLAEEVRRLVDKFGWESEAMTGVGYQEWKKYFESSQNLEETIELIAIHTRQYAKRQRTWFKRNPHIIWLQSSGQAQKIVTAFLAGNN